MAEITKHAQYMMVRVWDKFRTEHGNQKPTDDDEIEAMLEIERQKGDCQYPDAEEDPFAQCEAAKDWELEAEYANTD